MVQTLEIGQSRFVRARHEFEDDSDGGAPSTPSTDISPGVFGRHASAGTCGLRSRAGPR